MSEQGSWAQVVNIGEEISHPLGVLAGPLGGHHEGLELKKGLFRPKCLCMVFISGYIRQAVCDFQLIFATKGAQLHGPLDVGSWKFGFMEDIHLS